MTRSMVSMAPKTRHAALRDATADMPAQSAMRVLILGDHFGYANNVIHGVTAYFLNILPALAESGVELDACFLREPHLAAEGLRKKGIIPTFLSASAFNPFVVFRVAALIRRNRYQIIHSAGIKGVLVGRIAAWLAGSSVIVHVHDVIMPSAPIRALQRLFSRKTDVGIGVSNGVRDLLVDGYHVPAENVRVVHNGVPLEKYRDVDPAVREPMREALGIPAGAPAIALIARMHPIKGHASMLRIMARVVARRPDAVLVMAGDGPEREACEALAAELGLQDNVRFLGSRDDVPQILAACDLVVVPSKSEGLSLAAIEGGALGKPVVGFDAGGLSDVITDEVSGRLIPPGDEAGFAEALLDLIDNPDKRERFSAAIAGSVEKFSVSNHVRQLIQCYSEMVARAKP